jgi:hypothetical protein
MQTEIYMLKFSLLNTASRRQTAGLSVMLHAFRRQSGELHTATVFTFDLNPNANSHIL